MKMVGLVPADVGREGLLQASLPGLGDTVSSGCLRVTVSLGVPAAQWKSHL